MRPISRRISRRAMMGGLGASAMALGTGFYLLRPYQPIELESHDEIQGRCAWPGPMDGTSPCSPSVRMVFLRSMAFT